MGPREKVHYFVGGGGEEVWRLLCCSGCWALPGFVFVGLMGKENGGKRGAWALGERQKTRGRLRFGKEAGADRTGEIERVLGVSEAVPCALLEFTT